MKNLYLIAAIVGAVVPYYFFFRELGMPGSHPLDFVYAAIGTPARIAFTADLVISSLVFWAFMFHRRRLGHGPRPTAYIVLTVVVGLACALPAYLYAMEAGRKNAAAAAA